MVSDSDANTRYFHAMARGLQRRKHIVNLKINENTLVEHDAMALFDHFSTIFGLAADRATSVVFSELGILPLQLEHLDLAFSSDEIWAAIKELPSDKEPGPYGFTGAFYK